MTAHLCPTCSQPVPESAQITFDPESNSVVGNGHVATLTRTEFDLLDALRERSPRLVTKEQLLRALYPRVDDEPEIKIIDVFVCKVRRKLAGIGIEIETVWGEGYRLKLPQAAAA